MFETIQQKKYYTADVISLITVLMLLIYKNNINQNTHSMILLGIGFVIFGFIQLYVKDSLWILFWDFIKVKPIYVKLVSALIIFLGVLFILLGLI